MTEAIPAGLRAFVVERAENRCEYCRLAQVGQEATFHIDHVVPRSVGGANDESNLANACVGCSLRKGARQRAVDPSAEAEWRCSILGTSRGRSISSGEDS